MRYGFIGLGNMASAIIRGMVGKGNFSAEAVYGFDPSPDARAALAETAGIRTCQSNLEVVSNSEVVVLAVKPQIMSLVLAEIQTAPLEGKLFLSIAAGKDLDFLQKGLGAGLPIIRIMPNINSRVGAASTCISPNSAAESRHVQIARDIFTTIGTVFELPEAMIDVFMGIASAAPAYSYIYIDALARAAVKFGMPKKLALEIAASQVYGSAKMVLESGEHPYDLVDQVCSPAGTTIEGVCALQELGFAHATHKAVEAAILRDRQLAGKK
ncbi:MAG: pyrroline-5-carboxylate reductase [Deltaproteobacteria bacterium]|jgi:pyrroline-5-carboxylate reductase|nr:pyrroline-5-carboxylate reductase [Deltaproteobacteria bacterium]